MANQGPINYFPLNGLFDESVVGFVIPVSEIRLESEGVTVHVGNLHSSPISEVDLSAFEPTVGAIFIPEETEVGFVGLDADGTTVEVNAELPITEESILGLEPVAGVGYGPPLMHEEFSPLLPNMSIGQEWTVDELGQIQLGGILPAWFIYAEGQISQTVEIEVVDSFYRVTQFVEIEVFEPGQITQTVEIEVVNQDIGKVTQTVEIQVFETGQVSQTVQIEVVDHTLFIYTGGDNECWKAVVTLSGVDISTSCTGIIRVEAEEGTSRIAEFQYAPPTGAVDVTDWINEPVTIDYALYDPVTDTITTQVRIFGGTVDEPVYDPNTRLVSFTASDNIQQALESMDRADIDTITPGARWSPLVFDEEADNYQYSQDRITTYPASLDKNIAGSFEFTDWAAKVTPDYTFALGNIIDESLDVEFASRREIVNRIELTFGYGYDRLIERNRVMKWQFPGTFCDYIGAGGGFTSPAPYTIPNRDMITNAIESSGWCLKSLATGKLPRSKNVSCPGGLQQWVIADGLRSFLAFNFSAVIERRFVRSIREDFVIVLENPDSVLLYGQNNVERSANVNANFDTSEWENGDDCNTEINVTKLPPSSALATPCDSYADTDTLTEDGADRTSVNFAIETEIARARTELLENHRENTVTFDIPMFPLLERHHTVEIDTDTVDARGKVSRYVHSLDLTSGEAQTNVQLSVSLAGGSTAVDSPIVAPSPPDTITAMIGQCEEPLFYLDTHYGGINGSDGLSDALRLKSIPEPDEDEPIENQFSGYIGNKEPADYLSITYAVRVAVPTEEISADARDELVASEETPYTVAIPDELLNLFA